MIANLKPYPLMKESGLPWLGGIPQHWELRRGKEIFQCIDVRSPTGSEELLTVSSERGIVPRSSASVTMFKAESYANYKLCWPGDLVINSLWAWSRGLGVSPYHGIVSSAYGVYRLRQPYSAYSSYIHELVRSTPFNWELRIRSKGIWTSRLQLTDEAFLAAPFPMPSPEEQAAIARFLHHSDGQIRRYVRGKQTLIKLLDEQKRVIIHRAVTRGLQPSVRLRPSEVEWLGDVPEHWEVRRLKYLGQVRIGLTYAPSDVSDESGTLVLRASNIRNGHIVSADNVYVSKDIPKQLSLREGDILICVRSGSRKLVGKSARVTSEFSGVTYGAFMSVLRTEDSDFIYWVLNSNLLPTVMASFETSTINQLTQGDLRNLLIPFPPPREREAIAAFLTAKIAAIDSAIFSALDEIALIREYRSRLIADVVTGKLDVRGAEAHLPPYFVNVKDAEDYDLDSNVDELADDIPMAEQIEG